jgi:transposase
MEATGGYHRDLADFLDERGAYVAVTNPRLVRDFARAHNQLAKTDTLDARMIAQFGVRMHDAPVPAADENSKHSSRRASRGGTRSS